MAWNYVAKLLIKPAQESTTQPIASQFYQHFGKHAAFYRRRLGILALFVTPAKRYPTRKSLYLDER
jgi:hypothetical protein